MTFTSTLLAVLAGIAIWQLIIFFSYACGMEDNDFFVCFITCFYSVPLIILLPLIRKLIMFTFGKLYVKADFYTNGYITTSTYIAKIHKKLFKTDIKDNYYVTFEKKKFKYLPMKGDIYHKGQKCCHDVKIDNYLKKRD